MSASEMQIEEKNDLWFANLKTKLSLIVFQPHGAFCHGKFTAGGGGQLLAAGKHLELREPVQKFIPKALPWL